MNPEVVSEASHLVDLLRAELRLYGRFGRPVHLGHIARGLDSLQAMLKPKDGHAGSPASEPARENSR